MGFHTSVLKHGRHSRVVQCVQHILHCQFVAKMSADKTGKEFFKVATTYIFGAGASLHVGYPLASNMGKGLLDFMLNYPIDRYRDSAQLLIEAFGQSPNIEDVISELESKVRSLNNAESPDERSLRSLFGHARGHLGEMLREWFRVIRNNPAPAYAKFAERIVKAGDAVITFNYDDSLDRELKRLGKWDISRGYGFPFRNGEAVHEVPILKLHGSINWLVSLFGGVTSGPMFLGPNLAMGRHPVIHQSDLTHLGYTDVSGCTYSGGGAFPSLILPGRKKEFFYDTSFGYEFAQFWNSLWSQAADALRRSDHLVLCGYSLLRVDERACDLLLREPKKNTSVTIVSGNQSDRIANDFRGAGLQDVEVFQNGYFEEWVQFSNRLESDKEI